MPYVTPKMLAALLKQLVSLLYSEPFESKPPAQVLYTRSLDL
jgi:hypothetical protein